jgi:hypothetical protein
MDNTEFAARLASLNLDGIAITAGIDPEGRLSPVISGFDKMLAAAQMRSLPRVHTILAHPDTNLPQLSTGPAENLQSLSARNLDEAIALLLTEQSTRWGAIPDYSSILRQHRNLVGRSWLRLQVNEAIEQALADPSAPAYVLITGSPGTGKTAFVADQVSPSKDRAAVYHFIRRGLGQDDPNLMLSSLTAQLRRIHALPFWNEAKNPNLAATFHQTLERAAGNLQEGEHQVIWIDGLDEAFGSLGAYHNQALDRLLPLDGLPPGVVLIMTSRREGPLDWLEDPQRCRRIDLDINREANLADIREYLGCQSRELGLNLEPGLLDRLAQASEGCFMAAVRYLNPAGDRAALEQRVAEWRRRPYNIPTGLEGWLQRQWSILIASANERGIDRRIVYAVMGVTAHEAGLRTGTGTTSSVTSAIKVAARFLNSAEMASLDETMERVTHLAGEFFEIVHNPGGQVWYQFFHTRFAEFVREKVEQEAARLGEVQKILPQSAGWETEKPVVIPGPTQNETTKFPPPTTTPPLTKLEEKPNQQAKLPDQRVGKHPTQPPAPARWRLRPAALFLGILAVVFLISIGLASQSLLRGMVPAPTSNTPILTRPATTQIPPTTRTPTAQTIFEVHACMTAKPGGNNQVQECISTARLLPDGRLRLDMVWQASLQTGASVIIHPAMETGGMYLSDDLGNRYNPVETGGAAAQKTVLNGSQQATGWFIFDTPSQYAHQFVFHDSDNGIQTTAFTRVWPFVPPTVTPDASNTTTSMPIRMIIPSSQMLNSDSAPQKFTQSLAAILPTMIPDKPAARSYAEYVYTPYPTRELI